MAENKKDVLLYGANWCPDCDRVKRFLIEREIDFAYIDIDEEPKAADEVIRLNKGKRVIPVLVTPDRTEINPDNAVLADLFDMADRGTEEAIYDVVIIGGGVTGLSAAIYTTRERLKTLILERATPGGQILTTAAVENYPGFPDPVSGAELTDRLVRQAEQFGTEIVSLAEVRSIERRDDSFVLNVERDEETLQYRGRSLILAPGSQYRRLGVPGEDDFTGYGVSFCGTCDAPFYKGKRVVAAGGGNTAVDEGLHLLKYVDHLTIVQNQDRLTATPFLIEELMKRKEQVDVLTRTTVTRIKGEKTDDGGGHVTAVALKDLDSGQERDFPCDGVFVWIGMNPNTAFLKGFVELDDRGFIIAQDCSMQTSIPGLTAAGDCRSGSRKQIATAAGEGVIAALVTADYLKKQKTPREAQ